MRKNDKETFPYYNIGLGKVVTSPGHKARLMKEGGFIEMGNEKLHNVKPRKPSVGDMLTPEEEFAIEKRFYETRLAAQRALRAEREE